MGRYDIREKRIAHRVRDPILDLRPAVTIDGHGTTEIVTVQIAQIGNLVSDLGDRIAEATQNNHRDARYPELPQLSSRIHIFSFPPVKVAALG